MTTQKLQFAHARTQARRRALQALYQWQLSGEAIYTIEQQFLNEEKMDKADIDYFKTLLHDIPQEINAYNELITPLLDRNSDQVDPITRAILWIGCYELNHDVPWRVVIDEGVELAKKFGAVESYKYINGLLDLLAHKIKDLPATKPMPKKKQPTVIKKRSLSPKDKPIELNKPKRPILTLKKTVPKEDE